MAEQWIKEGKQAVNMTRLSCHRFRSNQVRLALAHPERITAIISQIDNAFKEGLSQGWKPIQKYWKEPTVENRAALRVIARHDRPRPA